MTVSKSVTSLQVEAVIVWPVPVRRYHTPRVVGGGLPQAGERLFTKPSTFESSVCEGTATDCAVSQVMLGAIAHGAHAMLSRYRVPQGPGLGDCVFGITCK